MEDVSVNPNRGAIRINLGSDSDIDSEQRLNDASIEPLGRGALTGPLPYGVHRLTPEDYFKGIRKAADSQHNYMSLFGCVGGALILASLAVSFAAGSGVESPAPRNDDSGFSTLQHSAFFLGFSLLLGSIVSSISVACRRQNNE